MLHALKDPHQGRRTEVWVMRASSNVTYLCGSYHSQSLMSFIVSFLLLLHPTVSWARDHY